MASLPAGASAPAARRPAAARDARAASLALATALLAACAGTTGPEVAVSPVTSSLPPGGTQAFRCTVTGVADTGCAWSVLEGGAGGAVTASGVYTAPSHAGTYHVVATSRADPTSSARATVTVTERAAVAVVVSPRSRSLDTGATLQLSAAVTGTSNPGVSWTVDEAAAGGAVSATGLYTAPSRAGVFHVTATSQVDAAAHDTATLTVTTPGTCTDACPAPKGGVAWDCRKRFMYGLNWAWGEWGADFGGIAAWKRDGVKARSAAFDADMKAMKAAGVSVVRWWMFPRFLSDGIRWGADGSPSGVGGTLVADLQEALRLADANDLYVMLTPFSFDGFRPGKTEGGVQDRSLRPMVVNATSRRNLLENVMKPLAQAVEASPYRRRVVAWDMMNEPEWALSGPSLHGDPRFEPVPGLETVTHGELETFLNELAVVLRASSSALITVGGAAIKWPKAWSKVDVDFYQFHYYDWVYEWFPYTTVTLASVGVTDKPVVMGEFPAAGLSSVAGRPARTAAELSADLWDLGYAGALAWAFNDSAFPWTPAAVRAFHDRHACETAY